MVIECAYKQEARRHVAREGMAPAKAGQMRGRTSSSGKRKLGGVGRVGRVGRAGVSVKMQQRKVSKKRKWCLGALKSVREWGWKNKKPVF